MSTKDIVNAQWKYVERKKEKEGEEKEEEREEGRGMKAHVKKQMDEKSPQLIVVFNLEDCSSLFSYGEIIGTLMFWSWNSSSSLCLLWRKTCLLILFKSSPWGGVHGSDLPFRVSLSADMIFILQLFFCVLGLIHFWWASYALLGFPDILVGKESTCNAGDPSLIPGLGRSAGERIGHPLQYSWASLVAQLVKNLPAMQETWVQSLDWEEPLKKGKATHSNILARRISCKESDTTERLSLSYALLTWKLDLLSIY